MSISDIVNIYTKGCSGGEVTFFARIARANRLREHTLKPLQKTPCPSVFPDVLEDDACHWKRN